MILTGVIVTIIGMTIVMIIATIMIIIIIINKALSPAPLLGEGLFFAPPKPSPVGRALKSLPYRGRFRGSL